MIGRDRVIKERMKLKLGTMGGLSPSVNGVLIRRGD